MSLRLSQMWLSQMWPSGLTWPWPSPWIFKFKYRICYITAKNGPIAGWNEKQTPRPQMWPSGLTLAMTLTLNFQGQIWNFLYLSQKWSDCHETKSKHIDWTPGLKCDQLVWPDHNLDLWILKVKHDLDLWPHTWLWPWIFTVKFWNRCIPEWEGRLTLHKWGGSRSFMTMTMTIWWPRSGVWIYQIVTGWLQLSACRRLI